MTNDLHSRIEALEARYTARESPLTILHWAWRRVSKEERVHFLIDMLTPSERRALQCGFEDEETGP